MNIYIYIYIYIYNKANDGEKANLLYLNLASLY